MTQRLDQLPSAPSDLWRAVKRLERIVAERAAQLLTVLRRTDGTTALGITPGWAWYDQGGTQVLAEDAVSGQGLALPYLVMTAYPARYTDWLPCTSGIFEDVHRITTYKQQAYAYVSVGHTTDEASTTGEIRVTVDGVEIGVASVGFGVVGSTFGPFPLPGAIRNQIEIRLAARRTAGIGNVRCAVLTASQLQA